MLEKMGYDCCLFWWYLPKTKTAPVLLSAVSTLTCGYVDGACEWRIQPLAVILVPISVMHSYKLGWNLMERPWTPCPDSGLVFYHCDHDKSHTCSLKGRTQVAESGPSLEVSACVDHLPGAFPHHLLMLGLQPRPACQEKLVPSFGNRI